MAMFDKHKGSKQTTPQETHPAATRQTPTVSPPASSAASAVAMIGQGININGDVSANSNLKVDGVIEGRAVQSSHDVEVGESGTVTADISARVVKIAGEVSGDISGIEKVFIARTGRVQGNISAPRVQLEDGALFRGSIDMNPAEPAAEEKQPAKKSGQSGATTTAAPTASGQAKVAAAGGARKDPGLTLKSG
jgi:cytoskeletal protein CcmA (bactofilin family)